MSQGGNKMNEFLCHSYEPENKAVAPCWTEC